MFDNKKDKMFPIPPSDKDIHCPQCKKKAYEINEIQMCAKEEKMSEIEFVKQEEGTYCKYTGLFLCTECYIKLGLPLNKKLHEDFIYYRMNENPLEGQNEKLLIKYRLGEI